MLEGETLWALGAQGFGGWWWEPLTPWPLVSCFRSAVLDTWVIRAPSCLWAFLISGHSYLQDCPHPRLSSVFWGHSGLAPPFSKAQPFREVAVPGMDLSSGLALSVSSSATCR